MPCAFYLLVANAIKCHPSGRTSARGSALNVPTKNVLKAVPFHPLCSRDFTGIDDHLRVQGLKIHLDDGYGNVVNWEQADLTQTIDRADEAGWQVSVHAMSSAAMGMVLDAYESALGPTGPNPSTTGSSTPSR